MILSHRKTYMPVSGAIRALVVVVLLATGAFLALPGSAFAADTTPPSAPTSVGATPGTASPTIATVTWAAATDDVAVTGYYVWRALTTTATPSRIGEVDALTLDDESGVPGQAYYYSVSAFDAARNVSATSTAVGPITAGWTQAPHATYTSSGRFCRMCHTPHQAATQATLMRHTSRTPGELAVCYACHDGQGASTNILSGSENSFALASGHTVEAADAGADLTNLCSSCHNVHQDYSETTGTPSLPRGTINGATVTGNDNTWCLACHNDTNDWYGAGYPAASTPSRDASGYPILGTFPGRTVYEDSTKNAHASIPATGTIRVAGDCLYCHNSHRADNDYDGLIENFAPSTASSIATDLANGVYAASCFDCHDGTSGTGADIKQFVTAGDDNSGHRIETAGGVLPVGAPLPCYDCHNPHGSTRGNKMLISDELGGSLEPTATGTGATNAAKVRQFCFTCHTTDNTSKGWDSGTSAYVTVGTTTVEGLRRDGILETGQTNATGANRLKLPVTNGHSELDAQNCYTCHGSSYVDETSKNVHNPSGGVSQGGEACYGCHGVYESPMEYDGADRKLYYHHVLGNATTSGDDAFSSTTYPGTGTTPTTGTDVYCLSCHVDHDKFNSAKASNLRAAIGASPSGATAASTDYSSTSPYGVCIGCHSVERLKDVANQKSSTSTPTAGADATAYTPAISGSLFDGSAHEYTVSSSYDTATFSANCSKCHNDQNQSSYKQFQTSTIKFGTHWDSSRRILAALGRTTPVTDSPYADEEFCYRCHSVTTDGFKSTAGRDWYGTAGATMNTASQNIYQQFNITGGSSHNVDGYDSTSGPHKPAASDEGDTYFNTLANKHVECADCHSPHAAGDVTHDEAAAGLGTNVLPTDTVLEGVRGWTYTSGTENTSNWDPTAATKPTGTGTFSSSLVTLTGGSSKEYELCLRCHSSKNSNVWSWGTSWSDVTLEFNTGNSSYHPVFGSLGGGSSSALNAVQMTSAWSSVGTQTMYCSDCHGAMASDPAAMGPHGSTARRVLKGYYPYMANGTTAYTLTMVSAGTATDLLCLNCHDIWNGSAFINNAHSGNAGHQSVPCTTCHLARPHGGKVSRLIVDMDTTPAPYNDPGTTYGMRSFTKTTYNAYAKGNCQATTGVSACKNAHSAAATENW